MKNIINSFHHFIDNHSENILSSTSGNGLEESFKLLVDTPENNLDKHLSLEYEGTPLWFYFLSFDYCLFDYFKERIVLKNDWDYTLLFNVDYIESSTYFRSLSQEVYFSKVTPFCPSDILIKIYSQRDTFKQLTFDFSFPKESFKYLYGKDRPASSFFNNAKINFNISALSHIIEHDSDMGIEIIHEIVQHEKARNTFLSQLSTSRTEDFFEIKINLLFQYPQYCPTGFQDKLNLQQLQGFVTEIISNKKPVDKKLLFKVMTKEHLILAIATQYFSPDDYSQLVEDKQINYHLLNHKLCLKHKDLSISYNKKNKI